MRTFTCSCKNSLYFDNVVCIKCTHEVGWCPVCQAICDVVPSQSAGPGNAATPVALLECSTCRRPLVKCLNYASYNVCNRFIAADGSTPSTLAPSSAPATAPATSTPVPAAPPASPLCDCCRFNRTIPDLTVQGNQQKWARLEAAKRRTLYELDLLGFPFGSADDAITPPLAFDFKADLLPNQVYRDMTGTGADGSGGGQKVFTGHADGLITINIQEADDVAREKLRVDMHEAQRSLLGHFRHEFGHYLWEVTVKGKRESECIADFGDHNNPTYANALTSYYQNGPKADWLLNYVSAYATMHAWEDFAETFALYLDMAAALDTAYHNQLIREHKLSDLDWMVVAYQKLGLALNEMNRDNGLLDYLPEVIALPVVKKLRFIHSLRQSPLTPAQSPAVAAAPPGLPVSSAFP